QGRAHGPRPRRRGLTARALVVADEAAGDDRVLRARPALHPCQLTGELRRPPLVVAVQKRHPAAARLANARISRARDATAPPQPGQLAGQPGACGLAIAQERLAVRREPREPLDDARHARPVLPLVIRVVKDLRPRFREAQTPPAREILDTVEVVLTGQDVDA